ncbi:MAG: hypothetical protein QW683_08725 [Candidatus Caldarchaeum sp.]
MKVDPFELGLGAGEAIAESRLKETLARYCKGRPGSLVLKAVTEEILALYYVLKSEDEESSKKIRKEVDTL